MAGKQEAKEGKNQKIVTQKDVSNINYFLTLKIKIKRFDFIPLTPIEYL